MANKFLKAEAGPKNSVIYFDDKGKKWIFEKGSRAWRNQNPGNMVVGKRSRNNGMIGKAGGFAVFPDYSTGHNALLDLLKNEYGNLNLKQLMKNYAPPAHNNTARYINYIKKQTGVSEEILIGKYKPLEFEKLWKAIEKMEDWRIGTIKELSIKGQITKVKKNKKGLIVAYLVDGFGWILKAEAIQLTKLKKIDAIVVKRNSTVFLRSRPNKSEADNLENKA